RRAQAAHLAEAARLNLATVAWQIRGQLRANLLDLAGATQRNGLLQQQLTLQQQVVRLLEQQVQAGAIASAEALPLRITLARVELDLAEAQRLEAEARARVAGAIGVPTRALDGVKLSFDWLKTTDGVGTLTSTEARRTALQSRTDILGALAEYAAAQSALQLEVAKQYPDVRLSPGYQYDQGDNKWTLGLSVELPVLHQNQGPIAEAKGRRSEAAARFTALQAKVLADLERAVQGLRASENSAARLRTLAEQQARRRDAVAAQYKAGATDQLDYLNAQLESVTTELVQLEGQLKLQQAVGALEEAVQPPLKWSPAIFESRQSPAR
ncbi:MAG TPA: TolC family protein, partial [Candidatus Sulfotelmatobacter sp.]|nr:TolC family protein [Candidatus Sulfotelmatobacter sp.]